MELAALPAVARLIDLALEEDLGRGDATSRAVFGETATRATARMVARQALVVFGVEIAGAVFSRVDPQVEFVAETRDGGHVEAGTVLARVNGPARSILEAERTALNFVQRLAGIATMSARFAAAVQGTAARVVDTRKTTPGYRVLEKAAVRAGGCFNHRDDLASGVMIKDNHIAACGSIAEAIARCRAHASHGLKIEVEVTNLDELEDALTHGAEIVLLDNFVAADIAPAVRRAHEAGTMVEVSGGITLDNVRRYADAGADIVSTGALTHSAPAVDIALDVVS